MRGCSFATSSPRLIPEGEKPDSFTGLALAPNEGRTVKGWRVVDAGDEYEKELAAILKNDSAAREMQRGS